MERLGKATSLGLAKQNGERDSESEGEGEGEQEGGIRSSGEEGNISLTHSLTRSLAPL
jgi:hypothetical protein